MLILGGEEFFKMVKDNRDPVGRLKTKLTEYNEVDLSGRYLHIYHLDILCKALLENKTVINLSLEGCEIDDKGAELIANLLLNNHNIYSFNFKYNKIGEIGLGELRKAVIKRSLKNLNSSPEQIHNMLSFKNLIICGTLCTLSATILWQTSAFEKAYDIITTPAVAEFSKAIISAALSALDLACNLACSVGYSRGL